MASSRMYDIPELADVITKGFLPPAPPPDFEPPPPLLGANTSLF